MKFSTSQQWPRHRIAARAAKGFASWQIFSCLNVAIDGEVRHIFDTKKLNFSHEIPWRLQIPAAIFIACNSAEVTTSWGDVDFVLGPSELPGKLGMLGFAICSLDWQLEQKSTFLRWASSLRFFDEHETLEFWKICLKISYFGGLNVKDILELYR